MDPKCFRSGALTPEACMLPLIYLLPVCQSDVCSLLLWDYHAPLCPALMAAWLAKKLLDRACDCCRRERGHVQPQ